MGWVARSFSHSLLSNQTTGVAPCWPGSRYFCIGFTFMFNHWPHIWSANHVAPNECMQVYMWCGLWYRTGWSDYSADLLGLSTQSFTEEALKRQHAALTADLWEKRPCWCQRSEENVQTASSISESTTHWTWSRWVLQQKTTPRTPVS